MYGGESTELTGVGTKMEDNPTRILDNAQVFSPTTDQSSGHHPPLFSELLIFKGGSGVVVVVVGGGGVPTYFGELPNFIKIEKNIVPVGLYTPLFSTFT